MNVFIQGQKLLGETIKILNNTKIQSFNDSKQKLLGDSNVPYWANYTIFDITTFSDALESLDTFEHFGFEIKEPIISIEYTNDSWVFTSQSNDSIEIPYSSSSQSVVLLAPIENVFNYK